jgi:hypothetical protein
MEHAPTRFALVHSRLSLPNACVGKKHTMIAMITIHDSLVSMMESWKVHITVGTCWKSSQDPNTFAGLASKFFRFLLASDESQASQAAGFPHHAPCDSM